MLSLHQAEGDTLSLGVHEGQKDSVRPPTPNYVNTGSIAAALPFWPFPSQALTPPPWAQPGPVHAMETIEGSSYLWENGHLNTPPPPCTPSPHPIPTFTVTIHTTHWLTG
ncbi:6-phosphofructokinase [Platysternon megacephalum]|uniref:6-phosphofructokinase n=1 Tax=Platysternon megacephalum TaxID=55544 RepID=A0A4D9DQM4_9SAUR|nr:6-phosphofructokinase [Platysternon megacephalum]